MASLDNAAEAAGVFHEVSGMRERACRLALPRGQAVVRWAALCAAIALLAVSSPAEQPRRAPKKLKPGSSCMSKDCHAKLGDGAAVHKPVTKKSCDACHDQEDEELHEFTYFDKGSALCYGCHKSMTKGKAFTHAPLQDAKKPCLRCHDPHSTASAYLIRAESTTVQCLECHTDLAEGPRFHKSRAVKGCTGCHTSHASDSAKLLKAASSKLCFTCHDDIQEEMAEAKVVHGPLFTGCVTCHDPHRPLAGKGLKKHGAGLCISCHEHFKPRVAAMSSRHPKLLEKNDCRRCHSPHYSAREFLLAAAPKKLCLGCHGEAFEARSGRKLKGVASQIADATNLHAPLIGGNCATCHQPHGDERFSFLRRSYPGTFYSPYGSDTYSLCFGCHDSSLAVDSHTPTATKFRDGNVNLHYVHVNKP
ncbi:MAG: cytochrome c3 family protein, partial [Planctomycetota bacterium]